MTTIDDVYLMLRVGSLPLALSLAAGCGAPPSSAAMVRPDSGDLSDTSEPADARVTRPDVGGDGRASADSGAREAAAEAQGDASDAGTACVTRGDAGFEGCETGWIASVCAAFSGTLQASCPSDSLIGCCTFTAPAHTTCFYTSAGYPLTAAELGSSCVANPGATWSTMVP